MKNSTGASPLDPFSELDESIGTESVEGQMEGVSHSACSSCATLNGIDFDDFPQLLASVDDSSNEEWKHNAIPKLSDMVKSSTNPVLRPFTSVHRIYMSWNQEVNILPLISQERQVPGKLRLFRLE